jgi:ubiquinone/menaquinone biosynthesis C-methylase UbiE
MERNKQQIFWDGFANRYDYYTQKFAGKMYQQLYPLFSQHLSPNLTVVEVGAGTGELAIRIAPNVNKVFAYDYSSAMVCVAKNKAEQKKIPNIHFNHAIAEELPRPNHSTDVVIASNLLHLLPKPTVFLAEAKRILKPGGKIIVPTLCHKENTKALLISLLSGMSKFKIEHRWSCAAFNTLLEKESLTIVESTIIPGAIPLNFLVAKN